jgi:CubicO group peptidase (beta-lactamase class C family)
LVTFASGGGIPCREVLEVYRLIAIWLVLAAPMLGTCGDLPTLIPKLMHLAEVPGLGIATVENGQVQWAGSFGVKNVKTGQPVDAHTVFPAASLSKVVFAYAVLKLVDEGKLDLDTPLSHYLPAYVDNDPRIDLITARHVLTHRTGFPNWRPNGKPLLIHFQPGERFSYSGEGFVYLQRAVEKITGKPLNAFVAERVFHPVGMTDSSYVWEPRYETMAVSGHSEAGEPSDVPRTEEGKSPVNGGGGPSAAATLLTTPTDYARFLIALMNGTGLKEETAAAMRSAQSEVDAACANCIGKPEGPHSESISWGLGVGLVKSGGEMLLWHWGDNGNYKAFFAASPSRKRGVVVLTNSANGMMIIPEIVAAALGQTLPAFDWIHYERYDSPRMKLYHAILDQGIDAALKQYDSGPPLDEEQMNSLGLRLLRTKKPKEAIRILERNVQAYPNSANAWDSLGWAYMTGAHDLAISSYRKSLELNPRNSNAMEALKKLEGN